MLLGWLNWLFAVVKTQKKITGHLPGFLSRKKDCWVIHQKRRSRNFEINFWGYLALNVQGFRVMSSLWEISRRPSDPSCSHPKKRFFGFTCYFSYTNLDSRKQQTLRATFLARYLKNFVSKFLVEPFWIPAPKRFFSRIKMREESIWPTLNFPNGQKLVQTSQTNNKYEKRRSPCHVRETSIFDERHHASKKAPGCL